MPRSFTLLALLMVAALVLPGAAPAQGARTRAEQRADVSRELQNPLPNLVSLTAMGDVDFGLGEADENRLLLRLIGLLPMRLTEDWNLVVWGVLPIHSNPPTQPGGARMTGVGDALQHLLLSPRAVGKLVWGIGPVMELPTAVKTDLGSASLALGPSVALVHQDPRWTLSLQAWHLRSVTGAVGRPIVERTHLQPSAAFTFAGGLNMGLGSEAVYRWGSPERERLTLPVILTLGRVSEVGSQPLNLVLGWRYYATAPLAGPRWGVRLSAAFTFPLQADDG